jgi:hypothetical protein
VSTVPALVDAIALHVTTAAEGAKTFSH